MNEGLIFMKLLKIMNDKEKEVLTDTIRTNKTDHIQDVIVSFIKKYKNSLLHIL